MENEQLNLFGSQEPSKDEANSELKIEQKDKPLNNTLFAIKDGKEVNLTIDEIFDKKFTKIKAITTLLMLILLTNIYHTLMIWKLSLGFRILESRQGVLKTLA